MGEKHMPTTTELTDRYLDEHPSIRDCLRNRVINYSKLARRIAKEIEVQKKTSMEAILIACRRYAIKLNKEKTREELIMSILKSSDLEVKTRIAVIIADKRAYSESVIELERKIRESADVFYLIEGTKVFTIIVSEKYLEEIKKLLGRYVIRITEKLANVVLKSPKELETTPGVVSYLYSRFSDRGINIVETMSCWSDTIFVVEEKDLDALMKFLRF
jgi:hypothetical protein